MRHSGRVFVYPSGRDRGTFIDEPSDDNAPSPHHRILPVESTLLSIPVGSSPSRQSMPVLRAEPLQSKRSGAPISQIQASLSRLERELSDAIDAQEFEKCVHLKPRIVVCINCGGLDGL